MPSTWPDHAVIYQLYPRSFADANGDGLGDIRGIINHIDHLVRLGVDAVWLNPFYPSPLADGGYDITDHRAVDPRLGTLHDLDGLLESLHGHGIRLIVDIVPNHVSIEHPWFRSALASAPGSPERARFHFADGRGDQPPNDWQSAFGGPAWTRVADGQWYFHLHAAEQPDLNWDHPEVRADLIATLRFWADRGVDGFRIDVANTLLKDLTDPINWDKLRTRPTDDGNHPTSDRAELDTLQREWRDLLDGYAPPRMVVAEAAVSRERRRRYATTLGQVFDFDMQDADFTAASYRMAIDNARADHAATGRPSSWLMGSHDTPRIASRLGLPVEEGSSARSTALRWLLTDGTDPIEDRELGQRRVRAALLIQLALPGVFYLFQGDELALPEVADLPSEALQDPLAMRSQGREKGRDGTRVPLPWKAAREADSGRSFGFGATGAHLPQPDWFGDYSVEAQESDPTSTLALACRAIALRHQIDPASPFAWAGDAPHQARQAKLTVAEHSTMVAEPVEAPDVLHFTRTMGDGRDLHVVANMSSSPVALPAGEVLLVSQPLTARLLPPDSAAWIECRGA